MIEISNTYPEKIVDGKVFVNVAKSNEILEKKGYRFVFYDDLDFQIAIFRVNGSLYCINNICPHRHQDRLFEGIINDDLTVTCPLHFWTYSLHTGENINKKQGIRPLDVYKVFEEDGLVWVEKPLYKPPKWRIHNEKK